MPKPQKEPLRVLDEQEQKELQRIVRATSERLDVIKRARALLAVARGQSFRAAAREAGFASSDTVCQLVARFNRQGLLALLIAAGRGRKPTYRQQEREKILETRKLGAGETGGCQRHLVAVLVAAQTARGGLTEGGSQHHWPGAPSSRLRLWAKPNLVPDRNRVAQTQRRRGACARSENAGKKSVIEWAYQAAEQAGIPLWCQDEAGPYQTVPYPGSDWHEAGNPKQQPHEYFREGTAKLLTLFRPATGEVRAKGVEHAPNAVLHPWLKEELLAILEQQEKEHPFVFPFIDTTPDAIWSHWYHWWWSYEWPKPCPRLRLILVWDNLAGHFSYEMVRWLLQHGILPLYTPLGGSWLNMAESVQRIIVRRALCGQHPQTAGEIITWLEETVTGWNRHPTPFVWGGKRKQRRDRARLRRLGGSGAALINGYSIVA